MRTKLLISMLCLYSSITIAQTKNHYLLQTVSNESKCSGVEVRLIQYVITKGDSLVESGIIVHSDRIETSVSIEKEAYVFGFGYQHTRVPRMSFECAENQSGKTFNGKRNGQKVGIWFKRYPWGGVRKAVMYKSGLVERVVSFRPNGRLRVVSNYKNGRKRKGGDYYYNKQGLVTTGMMPF